VQVSEEQITITVSLRQAEAIVDAIVCAAVCASGDLSDLENWVPKDEPDSDESDESIRKIAALANEVATMLEREIEDAYKRDPDFQQMMHTLKMVRKRPPA
jgi:hypothetical protein